MPARPTKPRSSRNAKPSFEIVHGAFEEAQTGWVYRSDAEPALAEPVLAEPALAQPALVEPPPPERVWAPPAATPASRTADYVRYASDQPPSARSWLETGLLMMTVPVAISAAVMFAPVIWMLSPRRR